MSIKMGVPNLTELKPKIAVIGVGGAGGNAVNNMIASGLEGVDFISANTDAQALTMSSAEHRIQMGVELTEGLGAGSKPEIGEAAAEEAIEEIRAQISGAHMVFVAAGMGGGTGTGAAPVIARLAREQDILTVGVVTKPFHFEGQRRMRIADAGIQDLAEQVDTLIAIPNQNLFRIANEKTTFADAFKLADQVLHSGIACVTDLILKGGLINLDFADVRTVMNEMGAAMMGTGSASGENRAMQAAEEAISNPLLDDVSLHGARGLLISIAGGDDLTLFEVDEAASRIRQEVDPEANVIVGAAFDPSLTGELRVSLVASGVGHAGAGAHPHAQQMQPRHAAQQHGQMAPGQQHENNQAPAQNQHSAPHAGRVNAPPPAGAENSGQNPDQNHGRNGVQERAPHNAPQSWQGPNDVTIEQRPPRLQTMGTAGHGLKRAGSADAGSIDAGSTDERVENFVERADDDAAQGFVPASPAQASHQGIGNGAPLGGKTMPGIEDFPVVGQKMIQGAQHGSQDEPGLRGQKKKAGFFDRLANVGRGKKGSNARSDSRSDSPAAAQRNASRPVQHGNMPAQNPQNGGNLPLRETPSHNPVNKNMPPLPGEHQGGSKRKAGR